MSAIPQVESSQRSAEKIAAIAVLNAASHEARNVNPKHSGEIATQALNLSEESGDEKSVAESLLNLGFSLTQLADHEKAFAILGRCAILSEKLGDEQLLSDVRYNLGILNVRVGNFSEGIEELHKSLAWRESHGDKSGTAGCYFQISYINVHFNDLEDAESAAQKALAIRKELNDVAGISAALMILGDVYLRQKKYAEAKAVLGESMQLRERSPERLGYFASLIRWAEFHVDTKEYSIAEELIRKGLTETTNESIPYGHMRFRQLLGRVMMETGNVGAARIEFEIALKFAQDLSYKSVSYDIHYSLWEICEKEENYKAALEHYKLFHSLKEEVISMQSNTKLKGVQFTAQIEFARKEAQLEKEKNSELQKAYSIIEDKQKEIVDSIRYAKRIQSSLLPSEKIVGKNLDRLNAAD